MTADFGIEDKERTAGFSGELDLFEEVLKPGVQDDFVGENNFGLGNYSEAEYKQQVESFKNGLFAEAAFSGKILERAIEDTIHHLGKYGYTFYDDEGEMVNLDGWDDLSPEERQTQREEHGRDRPRYIEWRGKQIWSRLPDESESGDDKQTVIEEATGITGTWTPAHWRMVMMRHEASKSKDARTQDNFFGRKQVRKVIGENLDGDSGLGILGGGKGGDDE